MSHTSLTPPLPAAPPDIPGVIAMSLTHAPAPRHIGLHAAMLGPPAPIAAGRCLRRPGILPDRPTPDIETDGGADADLTDAAPHDQFGAAFLDTIGGPGAKATAAAVSTGFAISGPPVAGFAKAAYLAGALLAGGIGAGAALVNTQISAPGAATPFQPATTRQSANDPLVPQPGATASAVTIASLVDAAAPDPAAGARQDTAATTAASRLESVFGTPGPAPPLLSQSGDGLVPAGHAPGTPGPPRSPQAPGVSTINALYATQDVIDVPEPASLLVLLPAAAAALLSRRRAPSRKPR